MTFKGRTISHFYAAGYGGQSLHCVPDLDLMMVITCWGRAEDADIVAPILMIYNAVMVEEGN